MAMSHRLQQFLDRHHVVYTHHIHPLAYTARELARVEHIPPHEVAKTILFLGESGYGLAVLPADCYVDLDRLREALGMARLRLANEDEMAGLFDTELGAMPPIGALYNLPVYVDVRLTGEDMIAFNGGTHRDLIYMRYSDFDRLVMPTIIAFSRPS